MALDPMLALLAQADAETAISGWTLAGIVLAAIIVPYLLGGFIAKNLRMADYGWKVGLILSALTISTVVVVLRFPPKLGVDLKGGVILVYEVNMVETMGDRAPDDTEGPDMDALVQILSNRINPSGTKEIVVRRYGDAQVEIIVPDADDVEIDQIKKSIYTAGKLQFRIVANRSDHEYIIDAAREQANSSDPFLRTNPYVSDDRDVKVGRWVRVGRDQQARGGVNPFKIQGVEGDIIRNAKDGQLIDLTSYNAWAQANAQGEAYAFEKWLQTEGITDIEVLMAIDDGLDVTGDYLGQVFQSYDNLRPCVAFTMKQSGAALFGRLTGANLPTDNNQRYRRLGIVLDDTLLSAPRIISQISDQGRITGDFSDEDVSFLVGVLNAGSLPATLEREPISENRIGSMLGAETINRGSQAIAISLGCVLVFILIYYRFAGFVACFALIANLVLTLGLMIAMSATLTLPGLAGLVLTVGMSVDANVLIFERIREELSKGAKLRMAIRNGFARASTTIFDANLTTLITAVVLYAIGTDQIRGFAVTLILGILMCMFTAIFCSRVIFDIFERQQWLKKLNMMGVLGKTQIDFIGKRKIAAVVSAVLITAGIGAAFVRGKTILDIDFRGGTSVVMLLEEPMADAKVRDVLAGVMEGKVDGESIQYTLNRVDIDGRETDTVWKVDSSLQSVEDLQQRLEKGFKLTHYSVEIAELKEENAARIDPEATEPGASETGALIGAADTQFVSYQEQPPAEEPAETEPATDDETAETQPPAETPATDETPAGNTSSDDTPPANTPPATEAEAPTGPTQLATTTVLTFAYPIDRGTVKTAIAEAAQAVGRESLTADLVQVTPVEEPGLDPTSERTFEAWNVSLPVDRGSAQIILNQVKQNLETTAVWQSSSEIGGKVAGDTQRMAVAALLVSLFFIVGYIWIRFQRVTFGLAAVVALVHDVLITLGAIAISYWLAGALGFLLIEEFKISLPVVAAFLTIIGYSLNDTIVVFDRIREVRGRSPNLTDTMINTSINQTLSRTLLTSLTTLIVVLILYARGGQGIHGFAFALVVGVMVGTYSSIFVASPVLLWMTKGQDSNAASVTK